MHTANMINQLGSSPPRSHESLAWRGLALTWNLLQPLHLLHLWLIKHRFERQGKRKRDDLGWPGMTWHGYGPSAIVSCPCQMVTGMKWVRPRSSKKPLLDYWPGPTNCCPFVDIWRKNDPARSRTEAFCKCASGARGANIKKNLWINQNAEL